MQKSIRINLNTRFVVYDGLIDKLKKENMMFYHIFWRTSKSKFNSF